ncbi:AAA family ATPase [Thermodesulfobacteriota bacterium]
MYNQFFGFKERPFQLVPNPAYLFLSRSHEEALAHLTYAISQGDGFVEMTGEVGTGKTTICRAFLDSLDESSEVAYIMNPKLDAIQLLKAINDEFGISSREDNAKDLIDILNVFLMRIKAKGKKVILLIDEAQNLNTEVLEQLRLLSNLETSTEKLLQIILVGQPELGELLDSHELRQLGQRITLSCHLTPLTYKETVEYIRHRLHVASQGETVQFTPLALRAIYAFSGGIPRLINITCDRTLLTAYGLSRKKITGSIAKSSMRELAGRGGARHFSMKSWNRPLLYFSAVFLALLILLIVNPGGVGLKGLFKRAETKELKISQTPDIPVDGSKASTPGQKTVLKKEAEIIVQQIPRKLEPAAMQEAPQAEIAIEPIEGLDEFLRGMGTLSSRRIALNVALNFWQPGSEVNRYLDNLDDDGDFFRLAAKQQGFSILRIEKNIDLVKKLNLPAILEFLPPGSLSPRFVAVSEIDQEGITLYGGPEKSRFFAKYDDLEIYWSGAVYIPWKNFLNYTGIIPLSAPRDSVITLKMLMQDIGFREIEISPYYDESLREAVEKIQMKHGILVDGIVGPMTKIVLYNEMGSLNIPHITVQKKLAADLERAGLE